MPGKGDYLLEFAMGHPARMGEGELLSPHWDPIVWLKAGPVEMHYVHNTEKEKVGVLVQPIRPPVPSPLA